MAVPIGAVTQVTTADEPVIQIVGRPAPETARADLRAASRSGNRSRLPTPRPWSLVKETGPEVQLSPLWTTTRLNVWSRPGEDSRLLTVLDAAVKVPVTGTVHGAWAEIQQGDRTTWVRKAYLVETKPTAATVTSNAPEAGVSGRPCPDGSSVENGLQPNTVNVYRAVCAAFPAVSAWGGLSGSGDHGAGRALDIMCTGSLGDAIADYVRSHASALGVSEVIWSQRIWTVQRGSEGWRPMEDRGSGTANHYDHVHVSVS